MAHFYSARLHSKKITPTSGRKRIDQLKRALQHYTKMIEIADKHTRAGYSFNVPEVELAREMERIIQIEISRTPLDEDMKSI